MKIQDLFRKYIENWIIFNIYLQKPTNAKMY